MQTDRENELHQKTLQLGGRIGELEANANGVIWTYDGLDEATRESLPEEFRQQVENLRAAMSTGDWHDWRSVQS